MRQIAIAFQSATMRLAPAANNNWYLGIMPSEFLRGFSYYIDHTPYCLLFCSTKSDCEMRIAECEMQRGSANVGVGGPRGAATARRDATEAAEVTRNAQQRTAEYVFALHADGDALGEAAGGAEAARCHRYDAPTSARTRQPLRTAHMYICTALSESDRLKMDWGEPLLWPLPPVRASPVRASPVRAGRSLCFPAPELNCNTGLRMSLKEHLWGENWQLHEAQ